jgi:hypothetical protein
MEVQYIFLQDISMDKATLAIAKKIMSKSCWLLKGQFFYV